MILSRKNIKSLCLKDAVFLLDGVVDSYLVSTLSHLTLAIEHEASTKSIDLVVVWA